MALQRAGTGFDNAAASPLLPKPAHTSNRPSSLYSGFSRLSRLLHARPPHRRAASHRKPESPRIAELPLADRALQPFGSDPQAWQDAIRERLEQRAFADIETLVVALARCGIEHIEATERTIAYQRRENRFADAYRLYRLLPDRAKESPKVQREIAAVHFEAGDLPRAVKWAQSALERDPCESGALGVLIISLCGQGRLIPAARAAIAATPKALRCGWALEVLFRALNFGESAAGVERSRLQALAQRTLGQLERKLGRDTLPVVRAYRYCGRFDEAWERLRELQAKTPAPPGLDDEHAELVLASGRWCDHIAELRTSLDEGALSAGLEGRVRDIVDWHDAISHFYARSDTIEYDYAVPHATFEMLLSSDARGDYEAATLDVALVGATLAAGGAEKVLCNAHKALTEREDVSSQLWIYSLDAAQGHDFFRHHYADELFEAGRCIETGADDEPAAPYRWLPYDTGQHAGAIASLLEARRPKAVHAWQDSTNLEVAVAAIAAGVPKIVVHPHNMRPDKVHETEIAKSFQRAYRSLLARSDVELVCVSEASLKDYRDWLEIDPSDRHHVVHNGFDWPDAPSREERARARSEARREFDVDPDAFVVGGMFRLIPLKRPDLWLETAFRFVERHPDAQFLLFGDGPELPGLRRAVRQAGLGDRILLPGQVTGAAEKCVAFDALLHTSSNEGLPTVLLEAQAMGIPVVAADVGGVGETLCPGHGALIDRAKCGLFSQTLTEVSGRRPTPDDRRDMMDFVRDRFGLDRMANRFCEIYAS